MSTSSSTPLPHDPFPTEEPPTVVLAANPKPVEAVIPSQLHQRRQPVHFSPPSAPISSRTVINPNGSYVVYRNLAVPGAVQPLHMAPLRVLQAPFAPPRPVYQLPMGQYGPYSNVTRPMPAAGSIFVPSFPVSQVASRLPWSPAFIQLQPMPRPAPPPRIAFPFPPPQPVLTAIRPPPPMAPRQQPPLPQLPQPTVDVWNSAVSGWEQATLIKNKIGLRVGPHGRWQIVQSIASGSYGAIFVAEDLMSGGGGIGGERNRVAVKFDGACRDDHLKYEFEVYKSVLYDDGTLTSPGEGFPRVYWYGHEYGHNILVMELLGAPVASLFTFCDRKFGRRTIYSLGEQMIKRIRHLHQRGFIHRDVKPENFLAGLGAAHEATCYLIDFGLARRYRYRDPETRELRHIPFRKFRSFVGTAKYASLNSHKGYELSRRDDLESLGYVLVELINGTLPWRHISKKNQPTRQHASQRIKALKESTNWAEVCPPIARFINYSRQLKFEVEPDYDHLLTLLHGVLLLPDSEHAAMMEIEHAKCEQCADTKGNTETEHRQPSIPPAQIPPISTFQPLLASSLPSITTPAGGISTVSNPCTAAGVAAVRPLPAALEEPLILPFTASSVSVSSTDSARGLCQRCRCERSTEPQPSIAHHKTDQPQQGHHPENPTETTSSALAAPTQQANSSNGAGNCPKMPSPGVALTSGAGKDSLGRMSWQIWRDSTQERRFQYENRFSWTVVKEKEVMGVGAEPANSPSVYRAAAPGMAQGGGTRPLQQTLHFQQQRMIVGQQQALHGAMGTTRPAPLRPSASMPAMGHFDMGT